MQQVIETLKRCDAVGVHGCLTVAVTLLTGGNGSTTSELGASLNMPSHVVRWAVDQALARGYLTRTEETRARGAKVYRLTPRGTNLKHKVCHC